MFPLRLLKAITRGWSLNVMHLYSEVLEVEKHGFKKETETKTPPSFQLVAPAELWVKHKAGVTDLQRYQLLRPLPTFYLLERESISQLWAFTLIL